MHNNGTGNEGEARKIVRMGWLVDSMVRRLVDLSMSIRWSALNFDDVYAEFVFNINANMPKEARKWKRKTKRMGKDKMCGYTKSIQFSI